MPFGWLRSVVSTIANPVLGAIEPLIGLVNEHQAPTRTHLDLRGAHRPGAEHAARDLEDRLSRADGVLDAEVNAVLGQVVVTHDPDVIGKSQLRRVIADVERDHDLDRHGYPEAAEQHPGNAGALVREIGALGVSLAGLSYSVVGVFVPVRALSPLVPAVVSLAENVPRLRQALAVPLGRSRSDTLYALGGPVSQGLALQPMSLVTGACLRFASSREMSARRGAWQRWERSTAQRPGTYRVGPVETAPRPTPLPDGPVEKVANTSGGFALLGYGALFALTRNQQRALAALLACVPRASHAGREAFATHLATELSGSGNLIFEPQVLRRLDRVDTVVIDAPTLLTGRQVLDEVIVLDEDVDVTVLFERASELIDPSHPTKVAQLGDWAAMPLADFTPGLPEQAHEAASDLVDRGATALVLTHFGRPVAMVGIADELDPFAEATVQAGQFAGTVLVAGKGTRLDRRLPVDGVVSGGNHLPGEVRDLQGDGRVVAVVSTRSHAGLAAADVGIGLMTREGAAPWGADVMSPNLAQVHKVLAATENARQISHRAAQLSAAGSGFGSVLGLFGPALGAPTRASIPVHVTAISAFALGTWSGMRAAERPLPVPRQRTPWHAMPPHTVLDRLGSSPDGLPRTDAAERWQPEDAGRPESGVLRSSFEGLFTPLTPVLGAGAVVSAALGSIVDAAMIGTVLGVNALIDGVQRVTANRELARLLDGSHVPARVRRDGVSATVLATELVPGDVIELHAGDSVPADCRVLEASGLELDEASLTGESQLVAKTEAATTASEIADRTSMLYQGTVVATGTATAVVVATGSRTELGRTAHAEAAVAPGSGGVEARLTLLTKRTLPLSGVAGVILLVVDMFRGVAPGQAIGRAMGLAVAAVPEGLPFVATVAELAAARRLSKRGVLVRSPATIEALGRVNVLCFDKTGTLTQGRISLCEVSDGTTSSPADRLDPELRWVVAAGVLASAREDGDRPLAHPTDRAVLEGARKAGIVAHDGLGELELVAELQFEPSRGFHAVCARNHEGHWITVKGAPEVVLDRCARWRRPGRDAPFDRAARAEVDAEIERLALRGFRVLAVAERRAGEHPAGEHPAGERPAGNEWDLVDSDIDRLDFVGLLALADPVHPTAAESVAKLQRAGVDVIMITGDHPSTAEAIAAELSMLNGRRVVTGAELDEMDDDHLTANLPKIAVFARVSPAQKARIVRQARSAGRVVAMTGDGANDVPAIRLAHAGIALGSRATPAAREAADLVVTDDRIETITDAIVEGRAMWASVHDALSILLGGNLGEIAYAVGTGLVGGWEALNARQLLVINLLTDVLPALAIAVRPPPHATPEKLLQEGPEASLGSALTRDVYVRATATAGSAGLAWVLTRPVGTARQASTAGMVALVSAQLGQTLAIRGRTPLVLAAGAGSLVILAAVVQIPGVSQFFGNSPLLPHQWLIAAGSAGVGTLGVWLWEVWPTSNRPTGDRQAEPAALPPGRTLAALPAAPDR